MSKSKTFNLDAAVRSHCGKTLVVEREGYYANLRVRNVVKDVVNPATGVVGKLIVFDACNLKQFRIFAEEIGTVETKRQFRALCKSTTLTFLLPNETETPHDFPQQGMLMDVSVERIAGELKITNVGYSQVNLADSMLVTRDRILNAKS